MIQRMLLELLTIAFGLYPVKSQSDASDRFPAFQHLYIKGYLAIRGGALRQLELAFIRGTNELTS